MDCLDTYNIGQTKKLKLKFHSSGDDDFSILKKMARARNLNAEMYFGMARKYVGFCIAVQNFRNFSLV